MGASAGATSSLWIGLQDDLSDKKSKDFYKKAKLVPDAAFFLKDTINISKKKTNKIVIALANWKWARPSYRRPRCFDSSARRRTREYFLKPVTS